MKVGFIGTGIMGSRMAHNLINAGHEVTVHNRTRDKTVDLIAAGATWAETPAAAATGQQVVITMLAHPAAVKATALSTDGVLAAMDDGAVWVDSSTVHPSFSREMGEAATAHGVTFLGAPVAGSKGAAASAQLAFIVGGPGNAVEVAQPLFDAMGARVIHVGEDAGMGNALKVVVNHLLATTMASFSEAVVLGETLGVPKSQVMDVVLNGILALGWLQGKREKIDSGDFTDTEFPLRWMQKDLHMAATAAYEAETPLPMGNAAKETYQLAKRQGLGDMDFSAIYAFLSDVKDA